MTEISTAAPPLSRRERVGRAVLLFDSAHMYGEVFGNDALGDELAELAVSLLEIGER